MYLVDDILHFFEVAFKLYNNIFNCVAVLDLLCMYSYLHTVFLSGTRAHASSLCRNQTVGEAKLQI